MNQHMDLINTCFETTKDYHSIAYYSHLIPVLISLVLTVFVLIKSKFSFLSKVFALFVLGSCLWLIGDVILWTSTDYYLINAIWAPLDYINILFYLMGAYFFGVLLNGQDIPRWQRMLLIGLSLPAWWITFSGLSITGFNQPQCEAFNNELLTNYKLLIEALVMIYIFFSAIISWKKADHIRRKLIFLVSTALFLFLSTFGITEYISSQTGIYEINLYSLFVLPMFLFLIIYSITNLHIFKFKSFGTQLLTYVLLIMVGSQFFFLTDTSDKILTSITFIVSIVFAVILLRNINYEEKARVEIERLATDLQKANTRLVELDRQKSEFVSFATHQLRAPLTAMKGYASMILEGDMGAVSPQAHDAVVRISDSSNSLTNIVDDYLNVSRIELGTMKYFLVPLDLRELVQSVIAELKPNLDKTGLVFSFAAPDLTTAGTPATYMVKADKDKLKQVISNLIDNSAKYTPKGSMRVSLSRIEASGAQPAKIRFMVEDTGVGIAPDVMPKLFQKFTRADNANAVNIHGTGLGLFVARDVVLAHHGKIWAESEGEGKGSKFIVELEAM